jgi:hypothetical protein
MSVIRGYYLASYYSTVLYSTVLYSTVLYCTVQYCISTVPGTVCRNGIVRYCCSRLQHGDRATSVQARYMYRYRYVHLTLLQHNQTMTTVTAMVIKKL